MSPIQTSAPSAASRAAVAAPIPLAPPVTRALRPSSLIGGQHRLARLERVEPPNRAKPGPVRVALLAGGTGGAKLAAGLQGRSSATTSR